MTTIDRRFSYSESQLGDLEITDANLLTDAAKISIDRLLDYDADRYNQWEIQRKS